MFTLKITQIIIQTLNEVCVSKQQTFYLGAAAILESKKKNRSAHISTAGCRRSSPFTKLLKPDDFWRASHIIRNSIDDLTLIVRILGNRLIEK